MELLLTILSVLAVWTLLVVLALGLFLIHKALENVRGHLEKIAMGVRAIEHQLAPLRARAEKTAATFGEMEESFGRAAERFAETDRLLEAALPVLRPR